jgi:hypothetical protein
MEFPNYIRTLLLNQARGVYPPDFPGEEYVPAAFNPRVLPPALRRIRSLVFGGNPDRHMMNFRLYQIMQTIHNTELDEYTTTVDSRITYLPLSRPEYETAFGSTVTTHPGTTGILSVVNDPVANDAAGRIYEWWHITVVNGSDVEVQRKTIPQQTTTQAYTVSEGLSSLCELSGSSMLFRFTGGAGSSWTVEAIARPARALATVVSDIANTLSLSEEWVIFGQAPEEPYLTFRNLWRSCKQHNYRLGAMMLALAFRTAEQPEA